MGKKISSFTVVAKIIFAKNDKKWPKTSPNIVTFSQTLTDLGVSKTNIEVSLI